MTTEAKTGVAVLALLVAAAIAYLALRPEPRHDGLTRAGAERAASLAVPAPQVRSVRCRAVDDHWHCVTVLRDGRTIRTTPGFGPPPPIAP